MPSEFEIAFDLYDVFVGRRVFFDYFEYFDL